MVEKEKEIVVGGDFVRSDGSGGLERDAVSEESGVDGGVHANGSAAGPERGRARGLRRGRAGLGGRGTGENDARLHARIEGIVRHPAIWHEENGHNQCVQAFNAIGSILLTRMDGMDAERVRERARMDAERARMDADMQAVLVRLDTLERENRRERRH